MPEEGLAEITSSRLVFDSAEQVLSAHLFSEGRDDLSDDSDNPHGVADSSDSEDEVQCSFSFRHRHGLTPCSHFTACCDCHRMTRRKSNHES